MANEEQKKTSYFKHYDEFFDVIKPLSEIQLGMLMEALAIYRGFPLNNKALDELFSDPAVQIAFNAYKVSIDKSEKAYENICAAARENGKKGGRPKKKKPQPEDEKPLILSSNIENCVCSLLSEDYDEGSPIHKLKNKAQAAAAIGFAAAYMSVCEDFGYDIIFEVDNKNALDIIAELRDAAREAFNGDETGMQKAFIQARDYSKTVVGLSKDILLAACEEYEERSAPA